MPGYKGKNREDHHKDHGHSQSSKNQHHRQSQTPVTQRQPQASTSTSNTSNIQATCFNCGKTGHLCKDCQACTNCKRHGHTAQDCKNPRVTIRFVQPGTTGQHTDKRPVISYGSTSQPATSQPVNYSQPTLNQPTSQPPPPTDQGQFIWIPKNSEGEIG